MKIVYKTKEINTDIIGRKVNVFARQYGGGCYEGYEIKNIDSKGNVEIKKGDNKATLSKEVLEERVYFIEDFETKELLNSFKIINKEVANIKEGNVIKLQPSHSEVNFTIIGKVVSFTKTIHGDIFFKLNTWFNSASPGEEQIQEYPLSWLKDTHVKIKILE